MRTGSLWSPSACEPASERRRADLPSPTPQGAIALAVRRWDARHARSSGGVDEALKHRRQVDKEPRPTIVSAGSDALRRRNLYGVGPSLVPASTAVPAATAEE